MKALAAVGLVAGVLSGLLGIGGGVIIVPGLATFGRLDQHRAQAASLAAIIPIAAIGAVLYALDGELDLLAAGLLGVGSLLGVRLGTGLMHRMDAAWLRRAFGLLLVAVAITLLVL
ncbi:MAG TPA: TSUP family transporter [candidate division Zixibacteria bacterium]|nr:TSUP family transporter [candidate division Zixibacteria bacterium]